MDAKHFKVATFATLTLLLAYTNGAEARCSVRSADPLIQERYSGCNQKAFMSYLYNDLITPYSFTCAKKISTACKETGCDNPKTKEEVSRCMHGYVAILDTCPKQIDDAALMSRCKDAKIWSVETIAARFPASGNSKLLAMTDTREPSTSITPATNTPVVNHPPLITPAVLMPTAPELALVSAPNLTPAPVQTPVQAAAPITKMAEPVADQMMGPPAPPRVYSDVEVIHLSPVMNSSSRVKTSPRAKIERAPANSPVTVEPLPTSDSRRVVRKSTQTSQSSRRLR